MTSPTISKGDRHGENGIIAIRNLSLIYDGERGRAAIKVLEGITLQVQRGGAPSASLDRAATGKSTLLSILAAMFAPQQAKPG